MLDALSPLGNPTGSAPATFLSSDEVELTERCDLSVLSLVAASDPRALSAAVEETLGLGLPTSALRIGEAHEQGDSILLWRGPRRWLAVLPAQTTSTTFDALSARADFRTFGVFDATDRTLILELNGGCGAALIRRCTTSLALPSCLQCGEARAAIVAQVPAHLIGRPASRLWLLVDRADGHHVVAWIRRALEGMDAS